MNRLTKTKLTILFTILELSSLYAIDKPKSTGKVFTLCYHTWLNKSRVKTDFSKEVFGNQIRTMKQLGYRFVTFPEIRAGKVSGDTNIMITIDDGNNSLKKVYKGIFKKNNILPAMFIYTGITGRRFYSLNFNELKQYSNDGCLIGGHGYYHLYVTAHLYRTNKRSFMQEIWRPKKMLQKNLGISVDTYAYPYGQYSPVTIKYLKKYGYKYAFKLGNRPMALPLSLHPAYELPRYLVKKRRWPALLRELNKNMKWVKAKRLKQIQKEEIFLKNNKVSIIKAAISKKIKPQLSRVYEF